MPGITSIEIPIGPFIFGSVRTAAVIQSARMPDVMKIFSPLTTYSSPSRTAVVRRDETSVPPPGSVMASAEIVSPRSTPGITSACNSALPWRWIGGNPMLWLNRLAIRPPLALWRASVAASTLRNDHGAGVPPSASA